MNTQSKISRDAAETIVFLVVAAFLILSSVGNAMLLLFASLAAMGCLCIWFFANRKMWLASISVVVFLAAVVGTASKLY